MNCCSYIGKCPKCGRLYEYLNIHKEHWAYCDPCRTKALIGKDLFPSWRAETEAVWRTNEEKIRDYTRVSAD